MLDLNVSQIIIQIIAFLVMFWVMKKFGWKPLLNTLEARQKKIKDEFDSIAAKKEEAKALSAKYEDKLKEIHADARKRIQEAIEEGNKISSAIQEDAQHKAKETLQKVKSELAEEMSIAKNKLKNEIVNLVIGTTEKILQTKLDDASQKKLIAEFVEDAQLK